MNDAQGGLETQKGRDGLALSLALLHLKKEVALPPILDRRRLMGLEYGALALLWGDQGSGWTGGAFHVRSLAPLQLWHSTPSQLRASEMKAGSTLKGIRFYLVISGTLAGALVCLYYTNLFDFSSFSLISNSVLPWQSVKILDPCIGFDASLSYEMDPPGCWRALKYRQLERLPEDFPISTYEKSQAHNDEAIANLKRCLADSTGSCHPNTYTVVLGAWWFWMLAISDEGSSGEVVWMRSVIQALRDLNYTLLTASEYEPMVRTHAALPDVISIILAEDGYVLSCSVDPRCVQGLRPSESMDVERLNAIPDSERGTIPLWKLFVATYWPARSNKDKSGWWGNGPGEDLFFNPLGHEWIISPFPYPGHTHIPFSIEKSCTAIPTAPHDERKDQIFVLAKYTFYFANGYAPSAHMWSALINSTGVDILTTAAIRSVDDPPLPPGVHSVGLLSVSEYEKQVGQAKAMLGIGRPPISPSVYTAMCQGVPVVLPYFGSSAVPEGWDLYDDSLVQHGPAAAIGPPHVYSYRYDDEQDLLDAIERAASTPIERFIPLEMKWDAVVARVDDFVRQDWVRKYYAVLTRHGGREPVINESIITHSKEWNRLREMPAV